MNKRHGIYIGTLEITQRWVGNTPIWLKKKEKLAFSGKVTIAKGNTNIIIYCSLTPGKKYNRVVLSGMKIEPKSIHYEFGRSRRLVAVFDNSSELDRVWRSVPNNPPNVFQKTVNLEVYEEV